MIDLSASNEISQKKEQSKTFSHISQDNGENNENRSAIFYGDSNTGAEFAKSFIKNFAPAVDMINSGVKDQFKNLFGFSKKEELPAPEETVVEDQTKKTRKSKKDKDETFEEVK